MSEEVEQEMLKMKMGKAIGPSGVPIEVICIYYVVSFCALYYLNSQMCHEPLD